MVQILPAMIAKIGDDRFTQAGTPLIQKGKFPAQEHFRRESFPFGVNTFPPGVNAVGLPACFSVPGNSFSATGAQYAANSQPMKLHKGLTVLLAWLPWAAASATLPTDSLPHLRKQALREVAVQGSTLHKETDLINIKNVAQPVTIITRKTIEMMGSRRLDEVLREQTGMAVVSDLGSGNRSLGLQMQGFGAAYIMILINGQPMTGRFNGNFDLSRINVSDIERIEVIKGASSSLFGCDALGGVINIITRQIVTQTKGMASLQHGTYQSTDATLEAETPLLHQKATAFVSGNYYHTNGFNVNTQYLQQGKTAPPYNSLNMQGRFRYQLNDVHALLLNARVASRNSVMDRSYGAQDFRDKLNEHDMNMMVALNSQLHHGPQLLTRYYFTRYATNQAVKVQQTGTTLQQNDFIQNIHRVELQATQDLLQHTLTLTGGAGGDYQQLQDVAAASHNSMYTYFGYAQANYKPVATLNLTLGARYDGNNIFGGKLNPTLGADLRPASWMALKFSVGQGFKAPTYAQLYQVFTNPTEGYTVIGANVFTKKAKELEAAGLIQQVLPVAAGIHDLQPETSTSWNLGITLQPATQLEFTANGFYNNIHHQIFSQQVGIMSNGQQLYSWFNIQAAFTTGIETSLRWSPLKGLSLTGGYQYLIAKDKGVIDSIKAGSSKYGHLNYGTITATPRDYFNLPGRSRHSANVQVFYELRPWAMTYSLRASYRGKYGFMDRDNNGYIDPHDVFVNGYFLLNASVQKHLLQKRLTLQLTIDNIFNYTDYLMPAQPGRMVLAGATWRFAAHHINETITP